MHAQILSLGKIHNIIIYYTTHDVALESLKELMILLYEFADLAY